MTREQAKKNLALFGIEEPNEEQVTNYLNQVNGEAQKEKEKVNQYREKAERYEETQKLLEEERQKSMTTEERLAAAENAANEKAMEFAKKCNRLDAERILLAAGLTEEDYKELIDGIITDDAVKTKAMANSLATMVSRQKEAAIQKTKEELMDSTPNPGGEPFSESREETEAEKAAKSIADAQKSSNETTKSVLESYL